MIMKYYEEKRSERVNRRTAMFLTAAIYFIIFTGIFFTNQPQLLPENVKEWLNIESEKDQNEIKKEVPSKKKNNERA